MLNYTRERKAFLFIHQRSKRYDSKAGDYLQQNFLPVSMPLGINTMATYSRSEKFAEAALRPVGGTKQHIRTNIIAPVSRSSGERESRGISPSCAVCVSPPATQEDFNAREYIFAMIQYLNCSIYLFDFQVAEHFHETILSALQRCSLHLRGA